MLLSTYACEGEVPAKVADYKKVQRKFSLKKWKSKKAAKENWPKAVLGSGQGKKWEFIRTVKHFKLAQI
nr:hypothetical protein [Tanacetum cinerariifolium]